MKMKDGLAYDPHAAKKLTNTMQNLPQGLSKRTVLRLIKKGSQSAGSACS